MCRGIAVVARRPRRPRRARPPARPRRQAYGPTPSAGEDGSSPLTMVFAVTIFLAFLLLATQVLVHLYATSTVTAVAFDTARRAAADGASCETIDAGARIVDALGSYGQRIDDPVCRRAGEQTEVTISGPTPARLVGVLGRGLGVEGIERTARVRTEGLDPAGGQ